MQTIVFGVLGLIGILETAAGIAVLAQVSMVFNELEGLVLLGFGVLTIAVIKSAEAVQGAVLKLHLALARSAPSDGAVAQRRNGPDA